jgi:hypothetical protein
MVINRQFFFGVVVGSVISLTFWAALLNNYNAPKIVEVEYPKPRPDKNNEQTPVSIKNEVPTSDTPKASDSKDDDNPTTAPEYPITADDVLFMVFTGTGRAEREDWGYKTWLKRLPRDSLVFYSDFNCTKVPNCVNVGGAEQGRAMKNKVISAFKHAYEHYSQKKWFIKLDDDSFIVYPRLLAQLSRFDWQQPHYMGKHHNNWGDIYCEGGAGYVYSIGMLNAMMPNSKYEDCMTEECTLPYEDLCTGRCVKNMFGKYCENIVGMLQEARRDAKWFKIKNVFEEVISVHEVRTFTMMDVLDLLFYQQEWQNTTKTM